MISNNDSFFSEREMNNLIQSCNEVLSIIISTTLEQDELKNSLIKIQNQCNVVEKKIQNLTHISHFKKKENEEREFILQENLRIFAYLETIHNIINQNKTVDQIQTDSSNNQIGHENLNETERKLLIEKLNQYKKELHSQNSKLKDEVVKWTCIRCDKQFREGENEKTCIYHPGKLKYYSCRGCGEDDYYTCCNKCKKCSKGCTKNLHQP